MKRSENSEAQLFLFDAVAWRYYASFFRGDYKKILATGFVSAGQGLIIFPIQVLLQGRQKGFMCIGLEIQLVVLKSFIRIVVYQILGVMKLD